MPNDQPWLQRLNQATNYQELQSLFAQLKAEASKTTNGRQLVASIDEAVVRIEQERARDREELQEFESNYADFRQQQRGILGWFRRHLPFTETRKQERTHKVTIADQHAEILADNLVIARAQMLKQKLLPPGERQLGESCGLWRSRFASCESIAQIREYAEQIEALAAELSVSEAFVNEIRGEIDSFAKVKFRSSEDRQRQQQDVKQAREELAEFDAELNEEREMQAGAIKRSGELVREELLQNNHDFFVQSRKLDDLSIANKVAKQAEYSAESLVESFQKIKELADQSQACAEQRDREQIQHDQLQSDLQTSQDRTQRLQRKLAKAESPYLDAKRTADRAEAAVQSAQRIYDQRDASADNSAIEAELQRVKRECDSARRELTSVTSPYERAKSKLDKHQDEVQRRRKDLKKLDESIADHLQRLHELDDRKRVTMDALSSELAAFEPLLNDFISHIANIDFPSHVQQLSRSLQWGGVLDTHFNSQDNREGGDLHSRMSLLLEALCEDRRELKKTLSSLKAESEQVWESRCRELLGATVTQLVQPA